MSKKDVKKYITPTDEESSSEGKVPIKSFVCPDDLWDAFGLFAREHGTNRSALLRGVMAKSIGLLKNNG